jgi:pyrroloquinoline quinone biosynthesis protein E
VNEAYQPYTLVAELTYRCPLRCVYCSNPVVMRNQAGPELETQDWVRVIGGAAALGAMQLNLSGGEPLARGDLDSLIRAGREKGFYVNLITSAVGLSQTRLAGLRDSGLDSIQISFQDTERVEAERIAGRDVLKTKLAAVEWARSLGLPLTLNVVMHRGNLGRIAEIIAMAENLGADRLELANAQYLGWALTNRTSLLPDRASLDKARAIAAESRARLLGKMEILFVLPDYYSDQPRACMDGWGRHYLIVNPYGFVLPCQAAEGLPDLIFENVRDRPLEAIWSDSKALNAYRGEEWMSPTCRTCDKRRLDFGGCRCQAYFLTGQAAATDPACSLSPHHPIVANARRASETSAENIPFAYRRFPSSP